MLDDRTLDDRTQHALHALFHALWEISTGDDGAKELYVMIEGLQVYAVFAPKLRECPNPAACAQQIREVAGKQVGSYEPFEKMVVEKFCQSNTDLQPARKFYRLYVRRENGKVEYNLDPHERYDIRGFVFMINLTDLFEVALESLLNFLGYRSRKQRANLHPYLLN